MTKHKPSPSSLIAALACIAAAALAQTAHAQNPALPDAKPKVPDNPYITYTNAWRWDIRTQFFLSPATYIGYDGDYVDGRILDDRIYVSESWTPRDIEMVFPVVREGSFYWTHDEDVDVDFRLDSLGFYTSFDERDNNRRRSPYAPVVGDDIRVDQKYVEGTNAEYTHFTIGDIEGEYTQLHVIHLSHVVSADVVFNDELARRLPWPEEWTGEAAAFLDPLVDTVGEPLYDDTEEVINKLVTFWIGEGIDPRQVPQLDLVKFLTGKVFDYFTIRGQATEYVLRGGNIRIVRPSFAVSANAWGGFLVRAADDVALEPQGSRHDLANLVTSVLRAAGIPARTVICIKHDEPDKLLNTVSMVEFAMHDPERDLTFWVPIDVDRVRVSGARTSEYKRRWLYFGTHDELHNMVPLAYYFHPPASYKAFNLPLLYGIRSMDAADTLPDFMIQSLLVETIVTPVSGATGGAQP